MIGPQGYIFGSLFGLLVSFADKRLVVDGVFDGTCACQIMKTQQHTMKVTIAGYGRAVLAVWSPHLPS